jgi:hypothetical protein
VKRKPARKPATKKPAAKMTTAKKPAAKKPAAKTTAKKPAAKPPAAKQPVAKPAKPEKKRAVHDDDSLLRGVALTDIALAKRKREDDISGMSAEEIKAIDLGGKPLSPSLAHWLANDRDMFDLGPPTSIKELIEGEFPEWADAFVGLAKYLTGPCVLLEGWGSDSRRFIYLGATDDRGEYPVFTLDIDDVPYACINGPVDVWLAQCAGALAAEKEYGVVPPAYEAARMALATKCFGGNRAYLGGEFSKSLDPYDS